MSEELINIVMNEHTLFEWIFIPSSIIFVTIWPFVFHKKFWKDVKRLDKKIAAEAHRRGIKYE